MSTITMTVTQHGKTRSFETTDNATILTILLGEDYTGISAPCGGNGTCRQCKVYATGNFKSIEKPAEYRTTDCAELLACHWIPESDCEIVIPETETLKKVETADSAIPPCGDGLGIAIDIGTTTVATYLYDLQTGTRLAVESSRNEQRAFGADVISRIQYCGKDGGLDRLCLVIRNQLSTAIDKVCAHAKKSRGDIVLVSIAGNTVMEHIFAGLDPTGIGIAPFTPVCLFGDIAPASQYFSELSPDAALYLCPALAGYVGGDITAGLLSSNAWQSEKDCLFIDIGTNGEMGIGDKNGYLCCATAAGPAFEGAEIECGMSGTPGAISVVSYVNHQIELEVIGDLKATGICGSGLIDALSVMLRCGAVTDTGRLLPPEDVPEEIASRIKTAEDGTKRFYLTDEVYISGTDIRQLQLAKSAIRAGVETLMAMRSMKYSDLSEVLIAGGFGAFMDIKSACSIGLLPPEVLPITRHVGNSAGAGASLALAEAQRVLLAELTKKCEYLELSSSELFMEKYIEMMVFDEYEEVFPDD